MNWDFPKSYHSRPVRRLLETVDNCQRALNRRCLRCRHRRVGLRARNDFGEIYCFNCGSARWQRLGPMTPESTREWVDGFLEKFPESTVIWRDEEY